jgi:lysozyme family protein
VTDDDLIDRILVREGGYVDHPADRGGPTNMGITMPTLMEHRHAPVTAEDVKALTKDEARDIYYKRYLEDTSIWKIPGPEIRAAMLDAAVNHGPSAAIKMLQEILGVTQDGNLGPITLTAIPHLNEWKLVARLQAARAGTYARLIIHDPQQRVFAAGWLLRLEDVVDGLVEMDK